jgi:hypothetical protein
MLRWAAAGKLAAVPQALQEGGKYEWNRLLPLYRALLPKRNNSLTLCRCWASRRCVSTARSALTTPPIARSSASRPARTRAGTWEDFARIAEFFRGRKAAASPTLLPAAAPADAGRSGCSTRRRPCLSAAALGQGTEKEDDADLFSFHHDLKVRKPQRA